MKNLISDKRSLKSAFWAVIASILFLSVTGCDKEGKGGLTPCSDIRPEMNAVSAAYQPFLADPSPANCEKMKTASLTLFEKMEKCPGATVSSDIKEVIEELRNTDCSEYAQEDED